jgi:predicted unusual protein kinase regulating ubiquinone biosynthesis (AarF/ABC1/UbiB family)
MRQHYISAPRIYFQFSNDEVMVSEFVHGLFMGEVLAAVDAGDADAAQKIAERGIDPQVLSRRMLKIFNWEALENLLFHADPHPANIIVQPDNRLVFIDFGSCGRFNDRMRRIWRRIHQALDREDVGGLVESAMELMEPLPPIDLFRFKRELELLYWDWFYALESNHAEWYERSTGLFWIKLAGIARRYNVPLTLDTLLMFRTMFAYDSIMYRLWAKLDPEDEYQKYKKSAAKRARKRVTKEWRKRIQNGGPTDADYMRLEELGRMTTQILDRLQHNLDVPSVSFVSLMGKAAFGVTLLLRLVVLGAAAHLVALAVAVGLWVYRGEDLALWEVFVRLVSSAPYRVALLVLAVLVVRRVLMRLEDVDVEKK